MKREHTHRHTHTYPPQNTHFSLISYLLISFLASSDPPLPHFVPQDLLVSFPTSCSPSLPPLLFPPLIFFLIISFLTTLPYHLIIFHPFFLFFYFLPLYLLPISSLPLLLLPSFSYLLLPFPVFISSGIFFLSLVLYRLLSLLTSSFFIPPLSVPYLSYLMLYCL